ncbi:MAG: hypothetical protein COS68_07580, partial [Elusimicrobia bacterium CG06_land_8_20_14_3_00_38_11]
ANNVESVDRNILNFTIDNSSPTVLNVQPSTWTKVVSDLPTISGTAKDEPSTGKLDTVKLRIKREDGSKYWDNPNNIFATFADPETAWFTPTLTPDCTVWTKPFSAWTDGSTYYIESKAIDKVGQYSLNYSTSYFKIDNSAPISKVTLPVTNRCANTFTSISGTASDASGVKEVKVSIKRLLSPASYFNGTAFESADEVWLLVTQNPTYNNWRYTDLTAGKLINGTSYFIKSRAIDNAVPELTEDQPADRSCYFTYDTTAPVSEVLYPENAKTYSALSTISGTAKDIQAPAPNIAYSNVISSVQVEVSTWTGSAWSIITDWTNVNKVYTSSWVYTSLPALDSGKKYRVRTQAFDDTVPDPANKENGDNKTGIEFVYDTEVPDTLLTAPGSANPNYGPQRALGTVSGTSTEYPLSPKYDAGIDKVELRISTAGASNNYWNGTTWVSEKETWNVATGSAAFVFTSTPVWQNGKSYTVESRGKDKAQPSTNLELSYSTITFNYDDVLPVSKIFMPATWWWQNSIATISGTAADSFSLIENVSVKISSDVSGTWNVVKDWTIATGSSPWSVDSPSWNNGVKYKVEAKAKDRAQNEESPIQEQQFVYDITVPTIVVTAPSDGSFNADTMASISGTALDYPITPSTGCLANVKIRVKQQSGEYWRWTSATDGTYDILYATNAWYNGLNDSGDWKVWKSTKGASMFSDNTSYWVEAIGYDKAGNTPIYVSTRVFHNDKTAPDTKVVIPAHLKSYRNLPTISGTALDAATGVATVKLYLRRLLAPNTWWKGGSTKDFVVSDENATEAQNNTLLSLPQWSFNEIDETKLTSGVSYWAYASGWDNAGNKEPLGKGTSSYFVWDTTKPTSTVTNPSILAGNVNSMPTISGTCKDISPLTPAGALTSDGLSKLEVQVSSMGATWSVITAWTNNNVSLF